MPSTVGEVVFSEPSGRRQAAVMFSGALFFLSLYAYHWITGEASPVSWLFFMMAGFALSGIAESLPKERRLAAGMFRGAALLVLGGLLATIVLAPEFVVGEP